GLTADFPASFMGNKHVDNARDLLGGLDWAKGHPTIGPVADADHAGASGHSLGGKAAILAATMDARIKATITLDPVDSSTACSPADCPDVSAMLPIPIPTGFVGETTDAAGGVQPCAPAADNFATFYANASAPSVAFEALGANHMSFLDDVKACGFTCSFCNPSKVDDAVVHDMASALVVAFYERYLRDDDAYDTYLTGAEAQARYVGTGLATIQQK
ncbi:MAG: hypothetical protein KKI08_13130, partial [Armatimonadetes bacterium]|nr:hypothetical protein [Armatimonadota bacterium]